MKISFPGQIFLAVFVLVMSCSPSHKAQVITTDHSAESATIALTSESPANDTFLYHLLSAYSPFLDSIMKRKNELGVQIIYTQIDRRKNGKVILNDHFFNIDPDHYYYPASTVKLPIAILALQKLNESKIPGLDKNTTMITGDGYSGQSPVYNDPNSADGRPTIANYIKKILLVSDNDAFNRLYEFLGQEYINNNLHKMGYPSAQIIHRLNISLSEDENRHTNPIRFYNADNQLIYEKPAEKSQLVYAERNTKMGKGYMKGSQLVNEPFDFSKKNRLPLQELHAILRSIIFPDAVKPSQRFNLSQEDYDFLHQYMSMQPGESKIPAYDSAEYPDNYVKFLLYGAAGHPNPDIRIFNKTGDAYGFMIDDAYIVDFKNNIEFMLAAVVYCNSDGIFNDDKYDYEKVGRPFMKELGRAIYEYELTRKKSHAPDLSAWKYGYGK